MVDVVLVPRALLQAGDHQNEEEKRKPNQRAEITNNYHPIWVTRAYRYAILILKFIFSAE